MVAVWNVREDLAIACMQLGKAEEAADLVNKIVAKFPASCRASRLKVLITNDWLIVPLYVLCMVYPHGVSSVLTAGNVFGECWTS